MRKNSSGGKKLEGCSPIFMIQEADASEIPKINNLVTDYTFLLFGETSLQKLIEASLCRSVYNKDNELVAFIAFDYCPNIPALPNNKFLPLIHGYYRLTGTEVSMWNTIYIHYIVWDSRYVTEFLPVVLTSIYKNNFNLKNIIFIVPPGVKICEEFKPLFTMVLPEFTYSASNIQVLYLNIRQTLVPRMLIRKAVGEDVIDLTPIINKQLPKLKEIYGEFNFVEYLTNPGRKTTNLIAEKPKGTPVGLMTVTSDASKYEGAMNNFFETEPVHSFRRVSTLEVSSLPEESQSDADKSRIDKQKTSGNLTCSSTLAFGESLPLHVDPHFDASVMSESAKYKMEPLVFPGDITQTELDTDSCDWSIYTFEDDEEKDLMAWVSHPPQQLLQPYQTIFTPLNLRLQSALFSKLDLLRENEVLSYLSNSKSLMSLDVKGERHFTHPLLLISDKFTQEKRLSLKENTVLIEFYVMDKLIDERLAIDFIEAVFECYPHVGYCLVTYPSTLPMYPLLSHFTKVTPRCGQNFRHELYFLHRNALFSNMLVRPAYLGDWESIKEMTMKLKDYSIIHNNFMSYLAQKSKHPHDPYPPSIAFVLSAENSVVGFAVIRVPCDVSVLKQHYNIEEVFNTYVLRGKENGLLKHLCISPLFHCFSRMFLRQIIIHCNISGLFHFQYPQSTMTSTDMGLVSGLENMTPVHPRAYIKYASNLTKSASAMEKLEPFALYCTSLKLLSVAKVEINLRIVVVGSSETAISFLENLIYSSSRRYIQYNNLILVSMNGFRSQLKPHKIRDIMTLNSNVYNNRYMSMLSLQTYTSTVYGILTAIDKKNKVVTINEEVEINYDFLFLFCGVQFSRPMDAKSIHYYGDKKICHKTEKVTSDNIIFEGPKNLFLINSDVDASNALSFVKDIHNKKNQNAKVLIYGHFLNAVACITALLAYGINGKEIVYIDPGSKRSTGINMFNNPYVDSEVTKLISNKGVTIHTPYRFYNWTIIHNVIVNATFEMDSKYVLLDCYAFFCFDRKSTNILTYLAISSAELVFNGELIIDRDFSTNDPYILAAGPGTRYKSCYYADDYRHKYYNSSEVGKEVCNLFRNMVEPAHPFSTNDSKYNDSHFDMYGNDADDSGSDERIADSRDNEKLLVRKLTEPRVEYCQLPDGWNYLHILCPGKDIHLEYQMNSRNYYNSMGVILETGKNTKFYKGYFRLVFTTFNTVKEITCLSKNEIPVHNYICLYGKHECLLNNLYHRYNLGMIKDFFDYFKEPWAHALYDPQFNALWNACFQLFSKHNVNSISVLHQVCDIFLELDQKPLSQSTKEKVSDIYSKSHVPKEIENLVWEYINKNRTNLPTYVNEQFIKSIKLLSKNSLLHKKNLNH